MGWVYFRKDFWGFYRVTIPEVFAKGNKDQFPTLF